MKIFYGILSLVLAFGITYGRYDLFIYSLVFTSFLINNFLNQPNAYTNFIICPSV